MERIIKLRIDKLFDNYIPCMRGKHDGEHVLNAMKSIIYIQMKMD